MIDAARPPAGKLQYSSLPDLVSVAHGGPAGAGLGDAHAAGVWRERGPSEKAEEAGGGPGEGDDDGPSEIARSGRHSWLADRPGVGTELGGRQYVTRRVSMYDGGSAARMPHSKRALTVPVSHFFSSL